jgi:mono/diheme cytochrome c family protein
MWYAATDLTANKESRTAARASSQASATVVAARSASPPSWAALGEQVFGNKCAACHQPTGQGLPGVFPPLKDSAVLNSLDPTEHIRTVLRGLSAKTIGGVTYATPMPAFADQLTDEEVAAVLSYERTS